MKILRFQNRNQILHIRNSIQVKNCYMYRLLNIQKQSSQKRFLGIFGSGQTELLQQKLLECEEIIEIKNSEVERLHEQIFTLKNQLILKDEKYEIQFSKMKEAISGLQDQIELGQIENQQLNNKINEGQKVNNELKYQICQQQELMNQQQDEIRISTEKGAQLQSTILEMQQTLIRKQDEQRKAHSENQQQKEFLNQLKNTLYEVLPRIESEANNQNLLELKQIVEAIFGVDKDKQAKMLILQKEKQLKQDLINKDPLMVFEKAKERILKLGRQIETLEKKNKQLTDRVQLYEQKKHYGKSEILSDRTSVI